MKINDWLTKGFSEEYLSYEMYLTSLSTKITLRKLEMNISDKEFATYLGIKLRKLKKWESCRYDFTKKDLLILKEKLNIR